MPMMISRRSCVYLLYQGCNRTTIQVGIRSITPIMTTSRHLVSGMAFLILLIGVPGCGCAGDAGQCAGLTA